jgi:hypothetical protein
VSLDDPSWSERSTRKFRTPRVDNPAITAISPSAGEMVTTRSPILQWATPRGDIYYYEVQASKDPDFGPGAFLYFELRHGGVTTPRNSYTIPAAFPLEQGISYYWRVRPRVQGDGAPVQWSPVFSFNTPSPPKAFGEGTWRVGSDIAAATYRTEGTDTCYWERDKDFSGSFEAIIANANPRGPAIVTIKPSDAGFTSRRCGIWVAADTVRPSQPATQIGDGTWRIGIDIEPGTYRIDGTDSCYWQRERGFSGEFNEIITNDNPRGPAIVTISPNDLGFTSHRCGTWIKAG